MDLATDGGGDEDVARLRDEIDVADRLRAGEAADGAGLGHVRLELPDVDAIRLPDAALDVADPDDCAALSPEQSRGDAADVAEALHHYLAAA